MAVRIKEKPRQAAEVDAQRPSTVHEWTCMGSTDKIEVLLALGNGTPITDQCTDSANIVVTLYRTKISLTERGGGVWEATVRYETLDEVIKISFSIGVESAKIYQALGTVKKYDAVIGATLGGDSDSADVPSLNNVIGVNGDDAEGVSIEVGKVDFVITRTWNLASLPTSYLMDIMDLTARSCLNDALVTFQWRGQTFIFPEGTLRFRGTSVKEEGFFSLTIDYNFSFQRNIEIADNFTVGASDIIEKEGWEYGWVMYKTTVDNTAMITTKTPIAYVVNTVYPKKDLNQLLLW